MDRLLAVTINVPCVLRKPFAEMSVGTVPINGGGEESESIIKVRHKLDLRLSSVSLLMVKWPRGSVVFLEPCLMN